jgi:drug/metabolite transporter (DMT)-like permease
MNPNRIAAFLTISLIWGSMWLIEQQLPDPSALLPFTAIALTVSAIGLAIFAAIQRLPLPQKREWATGAILGITLIALPNLLTAWASPHLSAGVVAVAAASTPLLAGFFCDTPWSAKNASIAGLGGVLIIVNSIVSLSWNQLPWAAVLLGSSCAVAASLVFAKKRLANCHPAYIAAIELAVAAFILGSVSLAQGKQILSALPWTPILLAAAGNAVAAPLYFWLLNHLRVDQLTSTIWIQLLLSVAEGIIFLRPPVDWRILAGAAIILASTVALFRAKSDEQVLTVRVT